MALTSPGVPDLTPSLPPPMRRHTDFMRPAYGGAPEFTPTDEQVAILDAYKSGNNLVVEALAGSGKTSTLRLLAASSPGRPGTYVVFNKASQIEAASRFPASVNVVTAHSLAYRAVGHAYAHRLPSRGGRGGGAPRLGAGAIARMLNVRPVQVGVKLLNPELAVRLAEATINQFCLSADYEITARHLPDRARHLGPLPQVAAAVLPVADKIWRDICSPTGQMFFTHDHYLKIWQLNRPQIHSDYILFDEAQDANPVIAAVIAAQAHAQRVYVGDRNQQLYAWRGAVDALAHLDGQRLALTASFRFGPQIAEEANRWLAKLGALRVVGKGPEGTVGPIDGDPDAILCRGNGKAVEMILEYLASGIRVGLAPGDKTAGKDIQAFAYAALDLQCGRGTTHPELCAFSTWAELLKYADEEENGKDLQRFVNIINRVGASRVIDAIKSLSPAEYAQVMVSTAHKAKGLEWNRVKIADDFSAPDEDEPLDEAEAKAEIMLAYVAVTRAKQHLDTGALSAADWPSLSYPGGILQRWDEIVTQDAAEHGTPWDEAGE